MTNIELPKDAEGREIPLDTEALYNEDGKRFEVNRFTYSVVQTMPDLKWGVVFMDCSYDYCISFYLTPPEPPDSWEKLEEDLDRGANAKSCQLCHYVDGKMFACAKCRFMKDKNSCANVNNVFADILDRIRKLRSEG